MAECNPKNFLDELRYNIAKKDFIKAKFLLSHFPKVPEDARKKALFELSRGEDDFAAPLLGCILSRHEEMKVDYSQVHRLLLAKLLDYPDALLEILQNPAITDKKPFVEIAGLIQCKPALPLIAGILRKSTDKDLNVACILAIGAIGDDAYITTLTDFLYSGDRDLTSAAVEALKELGTDEAVEHLFGRLGTDQEIDKAIVDALAEIQSRAAIEKISELLTSHDPYLRNYAKDKLVSLAAKAVPILVENLDSPDTDLLIHTLNILALIKDPGAALHIRKFLFKRPEDPNVRFAAYEALGELPLKAGAFTLIEGLSDPDPSVRMACAKALNRNMDSTLVAGIENLLEEGGETARSIAGSVIDSESDGLFLAFLDHPTFQEAALEHLAARAPKDVVEHFAALLEKEGRKDLAARLPSGKDQEEEEGLKIFVVDDSRMILKVFKSVLFKLGYTPRLFEFPQGALEKILEEKPDFLFTDLNMPGMNGVELTAKVREKYPKGELPIVMVTTQQDQEDREAAFQAGVDDFISKPFTKEQIARKIEELAPQKARA